MSDCLLPRISQLVLSRQLHLNARANGGSSEDRDGDDDNEDNDAKSETPSSIADQTVVAERIEALFKEIFNSKRNGVSEG